MNSDEMTASRMGASPKSSSGSTGSGARRSMPRKARPSRSDKTASPAAATGWPRSMAWMPSSSEVTPPMSVAAPAQSMGRETFSTVSSSVAHSATAARLATGTLSRKIHGQVRTSRMSAPTIGPMMEEPAHTSAMTPCTRARCSGFQMSPRTVMVTGMRPPPPSPLSMRPATSISMDSADAHHTLPATKSTVPMV